jgi:hypothetical protein
MEGEPVSSADVVAKRPWVLFVYYTTAAAPRQEV